MARVTHGFSVDVERVTDAQLMGRARGADNLSPAAATGRLLDWLDEAKVRATFFVLADLCDAEAPLIARIAAAGHEVACHGWHHDRLERLGPEGARSALAQARARLQDTTGQAVCGFRAPTWSLDRSTAWAVDVLLEAGFSYDSSLFPVRTPLYGERGAPTEPYLLRGSEGGLIEWPPALGPLSLPLGGGLYWRVLPPALIQMLLARRRSPGVFYVHPWEVDDGFTVVDAGLAGRLAMTVGRARLARFLPTLLKGQAFMPIGALVAALDRGRLPQWRLTSAGLGPV